MVQLNFKPRREQKVLLAACTTSRPAPAERPRGVDAPRPPLPLGAPARSLAVLAELRATDRTLGMQRPTTPAAPDRARSGHNASRYSVAGLIPAGLLSSVLLAMPMRDPAADPHPIGALLAEAAHVRASRDVAFEAALADDREAAAGRYADLAAATWVDEAVGRLIVEKALFVLDAVAERPELRHDTALLMALAPVVAMLKGQVA